MADVQRMRKMQEREPGGRVGKLGMSTTSSRPSSVGPPSLQMDVEDFKGTFSFDEFFKDLVSEFLPPTEEDDLDAAEAASNQGVFSNGLHRELDGGPKVTGGFTGPAFVEAEDLLPLFKDARSQLMELSSQIDGQLEKLTKDVSLHDGKHQKKLAELDKNLAVLYDSFSRLDSRISGVGQTAARIGEHLQTADYQKETANQTIELIRYLMEFNGTYGDLMELSPLFSDDSRVAEAAAIAQKLRALAEGAMGRGGKGTANASSGLEVAIANLQDYCNELENRLLSRFDAASHKRELATMAECAKILAQFNRGMSAMQRYVASRPMFIDVDIMAMDARTVLGDQGLHGGPNFLARGLSNLYKEIVETVRKEAATVAAVFPSPDAVMAILVQRVMEQRVFAVLDRILPRPSLTNPIPLEEGGYLQYLKTLAAAYERTQELAKELHGLGCGELDVEGLAEALFSSHREEYIELERASLCQLFQAKMQELKSGPLQPADARGNRAAANLSQPPMSVGVVTEYVRWNEEAVARCSLLTTQPVPLATNVRAIFTCLLDQVGLYTTEGLQRAQEALNEAGNLRERFIIGTTMNRRVAAAAAAAAEAAAAAGENSFRAFMVAVQRATTNVGMVQQHFVNTIARLLLPVDGAHAACCEEMATAMSEAESAALKGLQHCIDTIMAEVERLLSSEQKVAEYKPPEDANPPDHRPTTACTRVVAYLGRMLDAAYGALEGLNKQAFMTEFGNRLYRCLINHWQRFIFSPSGGLRLKRDVSEYAEFVRTFKAPAVDEKFELLGTMVNVFIVVPESLPSLVDGSLKQARRDAIKFIQLREDYKSAKIASSFASLNVE